MPDHFQEFIIDAAPVFTAAALLLVQLLSGGEHRHQGRYPFRAGLRPLGRMNTPLYGVRVRAVQRLIERGGFLVRPQSF